MVAFWRDSRPWCCPWLCSGQRPRAMAQEEVDSTSAISHQVPGTDLPIKIDGVMDEAAWEGALVRDLPYEAFPGRTSRHRSRPSAG